MRRKVLLLPDSVGTPGRTPCSGGRASNSREIAGAILHGPENTSPPAIPRTATSTVARCSKTPQIPPVIRPSNIQQTERKRIRSPLSTNSCERTSGLIGTDWPALEPLNIQRRRQPSSSAIASRAWRKIGLSWRRLNQSCERDNARLNRLRIYRIKQVLHDLTEVLSMR